MKGKRSSEVQIDIKTLTNGMNLKLKKKISGEIIWQM